MPYVQVFTKVGKSKRLQKALNLLISGRVENDDIDLFIEITRDFIEVVYFVGEGLHTLKPSLRVRINALRWTINDWDGTILENKTLLEHFIKRYGRHLKKEFEFERDLTDKLMNSAHEN